MVFRRRLKDIPTVCHMHFLLPNLNNLESTLTHTTFPCLTLWVTRFNAHTNQYIMALF